jgi:hypothetical protein
MADAGDADFTDRAKERGLLLDLRLPEPSFRHTCVNLAHSSSRDDAHTTLLMVIDRVIRVLQIAVFECAWWKLYYTWRDRYLLIQEMSKATARRNHVLELSLGNLDRMLYVATRTMFIRKQHEHLIEHATVSVPPVLLLD